MACSCFCHATSPYPGWCHICKCAVVVQASSYSLDESSMLKSEITVLKDKISKIEERLSDLERWTRKDECRVWQRIRELTERMDEVFGKFKHKKEKSNG